MPTILETAVLGVLDADAGQHWHAALRTHVKRVIVRRARDLLGSPPLVVPAEWDSLDDAGYRAGCAGSPADCAAGVADLLAGDAARYAEFAAAVAAGKWELNKTKLRKALVPELSNRITAELIAGCAEGVHPALVWEPLAQLIGREIYAAEARAVPQGEADCLHWSLLAAFFQATKIPDATRLGKTLRTSLTRGRFNVRGSLLRVVERTNLAGIVDPLLSHIPYAAVPLAAAHRAASQLVDSVAEESGKVPAKQGFALANLGDEYTTRAAVIPAADAALGITQEMVINCRLFRYQQYEYSALSLSAIAATEFLLRSAAEAAPALGHDPANARQVDISDSLAISDALKADLRELFASTGANFRNRSLHGGILEVESRRSETTMSSGFGAGIGVPVINLDTDPYIPRNAAAVALSLLGRLDAELAPQALASAASSAWTSHFCLDAADFAFGAALHDPTIELLKAEEEKLLNFVFEAFPCLSIPVRLGLFGWKTGTHGASLIQLFAFQAVMFEPAMRLVAHAAGFPIYNRGKSGDGRRARYLMLDPQGFLSADVLAWIEDGLVAAMKPDAVKTVRMAVRCRDAFAHGAIRTYDAPTRHAYGAVMAKALYLVLTAAINHHV